MSELAPAAQQASSVSGDAMLGMATLGKTGLALLLVIGVILLCSWLLRRLSAGQGLPGQPLKVRGSTLLGPRERVVIVEVADTWLVLGVAPGHISKLHEMPAPPKDEASSNGSPAAMEGSFANRLAQAVRHNLRRPPPTA